ncbi:PQQ-binding-like beta-propeller repeat protein [Dictyobacter aurantiacus]|uniref:Pyrrolo-quinoline quinone repeat domain-containing protein n=1 Tax=Dictyobacter aurantiacus TaxID=1936993 RepID=A0A401ZM61_9CHLR|nr:PQQ-binding-like beta-propeller repeat protein [Dictyobacter aurantiacus]GCE07965.1 hypothetical protein KDAU_52940 [Dictyobacter aurantiacus]
MRPSDELFSPETIDEQIAYLASQPNPRWKAVADEGDVQDDLNVRLMHELHHLEQEDARKLVQTRARLAAAYEARSMTTQKRQGNDVSEQETMKTVAQPARRQKADRSGRKRLVRTVSLLVAIMIIGSMVAIFAWNNGHIKNSSSARPTATPAVVKKATPPGAYTILNDRTIIHIDPRQKNPVWFYDMPASESNSPMIAIDGDTVYATHEEIVYAFDATTGRTRWAQFMPDTLTGGPLVANGSVYAITTRGSLYELQPENGHILHTYTLPFTSQFSTYHDQNILYISAKAELAAIDLSNGRLQWKRQLSTNPDAAISNIQVSHGIMLLDLTTSQVPLLESMKAFDVKTGNVLWTLPAGTRVYYIAHLQNDVVYYSASDTSVLHAYNVRQQREIWQQNLTASVFEMSIVNANTLLLKLGDYVLQSDNTQVQQIKGLVTLDLQHGTIKGQYPDSQQQGDSMIGLMIWSVIIQPDGTFVYMNLSGDGAKGTLTYNFTAFSSTCKPIWRVSFQH